MLKDDKLGEVEIGETCARSRGRPTKARWAGLAAITSVSTATWMMALVAGSYWLGMDMDVHFAISFGLAIALLSFIGAAIVAVN